MLCAGLSAQPSARKLSALALCQSLGVPSRATLIHLESIIVAITSVWYETRSTPGQDQFDSGASGCGGGDGGYDLGCDGGDGGPTAAVDSEEAAGETERRAAVSANLTVSIRLININSLLLHYTCRSSSFGHWLCLCLLRHMRV